MAVVDQVFGFGHNGLNIEIRQLAHGTIERITQHRLDGTLDRTTVGAGKSC